MKSPEVAALTLNAKKSLRLSGIDASFVSMARVWKSSYKCLMKNKNIHNYYVYIITNANKKVLYVGVTNSLTRRLLEHEMDSKGLKKSFTGRYNCFYLVYYEWFQYINSAIKREKELKGWKREKKEMLINSINPNWDFLNDDFKE